MKKWVTRALAVFGMLGFILVAGLFILTEVSRVLVIILGVVFVGAMIFALVKWESDQESVVSGFEKKFEVKKEVKVAKPNEVVKPVVKNVVKPVVKPVVKSVVKKEVKPVIKLDKKIEKLKAKLNNNVEKPGLYDADVKKKPGDLKV